MPQPECSSSGPSGSCPPGLHRPAGPRSPGDAGAVTAETALAIPSVVVVLLLAVYVLLCVSAQLRCLDAAHLAARAAARGDADAQVQATGLRVAPHGAAVDVRRAGGVVEVEVSVEVHPFAGVLQHLPGTQVSGRAVAADETAVDGAAVAR